MDTVAASGYDNGGSGFSPSGSVVFAGNSDDGLPDWAKTDPDLPESARAFNSTGDKAVDAWMARRDAWFQQNATGGGMVLHGGDDGLDRSYTYLSVDPSLSASSGGSSSEWVATQNAATDALISSGAANVRDTSPLVPINESLFPVSQLDSSIVADTINSIPTAVVAGAAGGVMGPSVPTSEQQRQQWQTETESAVVAGNYSAFSSMGSALANGNLSEFWFHFAQYEPQTAAGQAAKQANIQRVIGPPVPPELQRYDAMVASPIGAIASGVVRLFGGSQQAQDVALTLGGIAEGLGGGLVGINTPGRTVGSSTLARVRTRPIDTAQAYETQIRDAYGNTTFQQRKYTTLVNGQRVNGIADNVAVVNGLDSAIEAKYVDDWATSLRNPGSPNGNRPWAVAEQQKMLDQAMKYGNAFDQVIYHTNSRELADHYGPLFESAGVDNFQFIITPPKPGK